MQKNSRASHEFLSKFIATAHHSARNCTLIKQYRSATIAHVNDGCHQNIQIALALICFGGIYFCSIDLRGIPLIFLGEFPL